MTAETLMSVLRTLRSDGALDAGARGGAGPLGGLRRRKLPRVGVRQRLMIIPLAGDADHPAAVDGAALGRPTGVRLRNVAPRGLGLLASQPMRVGGRFLLLLPRERGGLVHLLGVIRRCREADEGLWDVGSEIHLDATPAELTGLVRSLRKAA